jgi:hypothetical protein
MPVSDVYTARSGSVAVAAATATAVMSLNMTTVKRGWVVGVRVDVGVTAAAVGNSLLFQLCRPANTHTATGAASGIPHDFAAAASIGQVATAWSTAPTLGSVLWEQELPQTTGSSWEEFPPSGYEWQVPALATGSANAGLHMLVTPSVATSTPVFVDLIWSE